MHTEVRTFAIAAILAIGLAGCAQRGAQNQFGVNYEGKAYSSPDTFRAAYSAQLNTDLAGVTPIPDRIGGRLLVVVADADRLRPVVNAVYRPPTTANADAFLEYKRSEVQAIVDGIKRSNLFDKIHENIQNDTTNPPSGGYDYVLWLKVGTTGPNNTGQWYSNWFFKHGDAAAAEPIAFDSGAAEASRMMGFVQSIRMTAARLGGPAMSGGAAPGMARSSLTGFAVNTSGDIVTSDHGVRTCTSMLMHREGRSLPATIVAQDRQNDLALLHVGKAFPAPLTFRDGAGIRQAEGVMAIGFPYGETHNTDATVTSGSVSAVSGAGDDIRLLQFTAPVQPGNSGGPLLDPSGHVVGIVMARLAASPAGIAAGDIPQNVNTAVKSAVIREFLDTNSVKYRAIPSTAELKSVDIAQQAKQAVVYLECLK